MSQGFNRKKWARNEDKILLSMIKQIGTKWIEISKHIPNRNPSQIAQRWRRIKPKEMYRRVWTKEEDQRLIELYDEYGSQWTKIQGYFKNRESKTIRERYINCLDPRLNKSEFTREEDDYIYNRYLEIGPKWAQISKEINHRSENQVKNRFHHKIRKYYMNIKHPYFQSFNQQKIDKSSLPQKEEIVTDFIEYSEYSNIQDQEFSLCYFYSIHTSHLNN